MACEKISFRERNRRNRGQAELLLDARRPANLLRAET